jgi:hypothetical protein
VNNYHRVILLVRHLVHFFYIDFPYQTWSDLVKKDESLAHDTFFYINFFRRASPIVTVFLSLGRDLSTSQQTEFFIFTFSFYSRIMKDAIQKLDKTQFYFYFNFWQCDS